MSQMNPERREFLIQTFDEALASVFESYFFLDVQPAPELAAEAGPELEVELAFRGAFSGRLSLRLARSTALALIETLPLSQEGHEEETLRDVFAEIVNAIGGRVAAGLAGDEFAFDLTIPEVHAPAPGKLSDVAASRSYATDFGPMVLSLTHWQEHSLIKGA